MKVGYDARTSFRGFAKEALIANRQTPNYKYKIELRVKQENVLVAGVLYQVYETRELVNNVPVGGRILYNITTKKL